MADFNPVAVLGSVKSMILADARKTGILPSLTASQMMIESGWLRSGLTVKANNAFGIKGSYNGQYYACKTQEWENGKYITITAKFKKYPSLAESVADHSALLCKPRYAAVKAAKDYKAACKAVKACGYATAPKYAESLIAFVEKYKLYEWDKLAESAASAYTGTLPMLSAKGYLGKGDTGAQVKRLQQFLNWYGGYGLAVDGSYGPATVAAVKRYQQAEGLAADGKFGPASRARASEVRK